jgi:hypothetical protein
LLPLQTVLIKIFSSVELFQLSPDRLDRNISSVTRWPQWFFSLAEVQILNPQTPPQKTIEKGSLLSLAIDPKKGLKKKFNITVEVLHYSPGKDLHLKILKDSSGRLTRLFDSLEWIIHFQPKDSGSLIQGTVTAHTCHWKSRLFGKIAEKIILHQVFYPNIVKLAELKQPFSVDSPESHFGFMP